MCVSAPVARHNVPLYLTELGEEGASRVFGALLLLLTRAFRPAPRNTAATSVSTVQRPLFEGPR